MEPELEAIIRAYDAAQEASAQEVVERQTEFERRFTELAARCPRVSREGLLNAVRLAHQKWLRAQRGPPTMPPRA